jgi:hypothetical protein
MIMYRQTKDGNELLKAVIRVTDNSTVSSFIPFDPDNTDYQEYLKWLADGNTPEPADSE